MLLKVYYCSVFAFGESYPVLFTARALQGLGSACSSVSGEFAMRTIIQAIKISRLDNNQFEVSLDYFFCSFLSHSLLIVGCIGFVRGFYFLSSDWSCSHSRLLIGILGTLLRKYLLIIDRSCWR